MKLRYLYLAIGVLCNASLVSCGDSFKEKTEIVACGISTNALTFGVSSTEVQTVDITSEAAWEVAVDQAGGDSVSYTHLDVYKRQVPIQSNVSLSSKMLTTVRSLTPLGLFSGTSL